MPMIDNATAKAGAPNLNDFAGAMCVSIRLASSLILVPLTSSPLRPARIKRVPISPLAGVLQADARSVVHARVLAGWEKPTGLQGLAQPGLIVSFSSWKYRKGLVLFSSGNQGGHRKTKYAR